MLKIFLKKNWKTNQKGISIYIAMGFMTTIILISLGVSSVIISFLSGSGNIEIMNQSFFAAEGGMEDALYDLSDHFLGYENTQHQVSEKFSDTNNTNYSWEINSLLPFDDELNAYVIPPKGEGSSVISPNWNILRLGGRAVISLFIDESIPKSLVRDCVKIDNPTNCDIRSISDVAHFGLVDIAVKIRARNKDLNITEIEDNEISEESSMSDDTILTWGFVGLDKTDYSKYISIRENAKYKKSISGNLKITRDYSNSTEIYESKINNHTSIDDYLIIDSTDLTPQGSYTKGSRISSGIDHKNNYSTINSFLSNSLIHRPQFILTLVSSLFDNSVDNSAIPFIEYQVLLKSNNPLPNEYFLIKSKGFSGGFEQSIITKYKPQSSTPLLDFAIFQ